MTYVDYNYYSSAYGGTLVSSTEFAAVEKAAERIIDAVTRFYIMDKGLSSFPEKMQTLIKNAVCAQIDYYGYYGLDVEVTGTAPTGFTVGQVSIHSSSGAGAEHVSALCPMAKSMLEQTGLLSRMIGVAGEAFAPFPLGVGY